MWHFMATGCNVECLILCSLKIFPWGVVDYRCILCTCILHIMHILCRRLERHNMMLLVRRQKCNPAYEKSAIADLKKLSCFDIFFFHLKNRTIKQKNWQYKFIVKMLFNSLLKCELVRRNFCYIHNIKQDVPHLSTSFSFISIRIIWLTVEYQTRK